MQYDALNNSNLVFIHFLQNSGGVGFSFGMAHHPDVLTVNDTFITFDESRNQTFDNCAMNKKLELFANPLITKIAEVPEDQNKAFWGFSLNQILGLESEGTDAFNPGSLELLSNYKCALFNRDISKTVMDQATALLPNAKHIFLTVPKMNFDAVALGINGNPNVHVVDMYSSASAWDVNGFVDSVKSTLTWLGLDNTQIDSSVTTCMTKFFDNIFKTQADYIAAFG